MKTERRHELQTNELADWLSGSIENAKPYSRAIVGILLAVVVIIGTSWFISSRSAEKRAAGWNDFFEGYLAGNSTDLRETAEAHPESPAGLWARLLLADEELDQGIRLLFSERGSARDQLEKAIADYAAVSDAADDPLLQQRAVFGTAKAQEALGDLNKARQAYQMLVNQWPDSPFAMLAQARLTDLERQSTKDFYQWFAEWKPPVVKEQPPPAPKEPGLNIDLPFSDIPSALEPPSAAPAGKTTTAATSAAKPAGNSTPK